MVGTRSTASHFAQGSWDALERVQADKFSAPLCNMLFSACSAYFAVKVRRFCLRPSTVQRFNGSTHFKNFTLGRSRHLERGLFLRDCFSKQALECCIVMGRVMMESQEVPRAGQCGKLDGLRQGTVP